MLNFLLDLGTYEQRCVGRDDFDWGFVSTAAVSDGQHPFETAVEHREYNGGKMVIVEAYTSRDEAQRGHERWLDTMLSDDLPEALVDCGNSSVSQLCAEIDGEGVMRFPRQPRST